MMPSSTCAHDGVRAIVPLAALLAAQLAVAGLWATTLANLTLLCFSLPGLVLHRTRRERWTWPSGVAYVGLGAATSMLVIAGVGAALDWFDLRLVVASSLVTTAVAAILGRRFPSDSASAAPMTLGRPFNLAMIAILVVTVIPMLVAGESASEGLVFRAFFNADYFKHMGIAGSFSSGVLPPIDPFGAPARLHYYWFQHLLPGTALAIGGFRDSPLGFSLAIGLAQTLALATLIFGLGRQAGASAIGTMLAVLIGVATPSLDVLALFGANSADAGILWDINQELLTATSLVGGHSEVAGSSLFRLNLYVPVHQLALVFFLAWLTLRTHGSPPALLITPLIAALCCVSTLLGGILVATICLHTLVRHGEKALSRERALLTASLISLGLPFLFGIVDLSASHARLLVATDGLKHALWDRAIWFLPQWLATFGPMFLFVFWRGRYRPGEVHRVAWTMVIVATVFAFLADVLPISGHLRVDSQLKASFAAWVGVVVLMATPLSAIRAPQLQILAAVCGLLAAVSLAHDLLWHTGITAGRSAFAVDSVLIPADDVLAATWIRQQLPAGAVLQDWPEPDFLKGGRDTWIPVLGNHPVRYGYRGTRTTEADISFAKTLFGPGVTAQAIIDASRQKIDYLYVSRSKGGTRYARTVAAYGRLPSLERVYQNESVQIWKIKNVQELH